MAFFEGITWLNNGWVPEDRHWNTRQFTGLYGINYIHSGPFELQFNEGPVQTLQGPCVWLHYPGPRFAYGTSDPTITWNNRFLNFTGPRVEMFIKHGLFPVTEHIPLYPINKPDAFRTLFDDLQAQVNHPEWDDETTIHLLEGLLLQLHRQTRSYSQPDVVVRRLWKLHNDIRRNAAAPWDFKIEAGNMNLSYSHFRRIFKEVIGVSPNHALIQLRLDRSTHLLLNSNRTIADIASLVGYPDQHYFMRAFKKHYHMSPGRYRKELTQTGSPVVRRPSVCGPIRSCVTW